MSQRLITIERHIQMQQKAFPHATGTFTAMLQDMALAAKLIARETTRAGLANILGAADSQNAFGERQQKLDLFADEVIASLNRDAGRVCAMVSEERDDLIDIPLHYDTGKYVLLYDPLDGSSNIDVNVSIGTIFSIHRKFTRGDRGTLEDVLQEGKRLLAAGYVIYGSSTMMVYTTGGGVHGFTLDPAIGEFILSHPDIRIPDTPRYYSVNHANARHWPEGVRRFVDELQGAEGAAPLQSRYIGSMVSDFHRNLLQGGIYLYPGDARKPQGKIRLMVEAQALGFIAEQAGGYASDGIGDVLDIRPHSLQQRVPFFVGSRSLVERAEALIREHDHAWIQEYSQYRERTPA